ncbi:MAG: choice-of-anchor tandem repeat GloVer-containing protein, partial [Candidatus Korobacteraceae bacterium]
AAGLVMDAAGNLYGATTDGGSGGGGTVFELSPMGNTWVFTLLYSLSGQQGQTCGTWAPLTIDNSANLYGTTYCGGANGFGNIFKLTNTQIGWEYTSLHDFTWGTDGALSASTVTIDTDGTLYGTASHGGNNSDSGVVWMIKP